MRRLMFLFLVTGCATVPPRPAAPPPAPDEVGDPQTYEDLNVFFARKRPHVGQCYNNAFAQVDPKLRRRGFVTVEMQVTPAGKAEDIHVAGSTLASKEVEECLVQLVSKWTLPQPPQKMAFSYSYDFRPE